MVTRCPFFVSMYPQAPPFGGMHLTFLEGGAHKPPLPPLFCEMLSVT